MRTVFLILFMVSLVPGLSVSSASVRSTKTLPDIAIKRSRQPSGYSADTAMIHNITRDAFMYIKSSKKLPVVKEGIDSALAICEKKKIEIPADLHLLMAEYYYMTGDLRTASEEVSLALRKATDNKEYYALARTLIFMGSYYTRTGLYKEAMENYESSIELAREKKLRGIIPRAYRGKANVFDAVGDLPKYRENLSLVAETSFAEKDTAIAEEAFLMLGTSLTDKSRNFRQADSVLRLCLDLSLVKKDTFYTAYSSANIGWNFYAEKIYDSSLFYYKQSLRYSMPIRQYSISANSLGNMGTIYRDLNETETSIKYYQESIAYATKASDWYSLSWVYNDMHQLYLKLKDTANAFTSYVRYKQFNDSVLIKQNSQGLADARIRYEADTHNKEVELLSLRLKNTRILNYGFTALIVLMATIGLLIFRGVRLKNERKLSEMKRQISEITQANLRQQMNPHFIFNTLNSIQYYMYQHDKLATNNYLTKFANLMRKVLENSRQTSIPLQDELHALNLYLELESIRFKDKFEYKIKVDEEIDPLMYKVPAMLIQPYVENSICHGLMPKEGRGHVSIDLKLNGGSILCTIEDNGIGREAAAVRRSKSENNHNSVGTSIVSSRLDLVNSLYGTTLKTRYTDLKNENGDAEGTRVEIHIPVIT